MTHASCRLPSSACPPNRGDVEAAVDEIVEEFDDAECLGATKLERRAAGNSVPPAVHVEILLSRLSEPGPYADVESDWLVHGGTGRVHRITRLAEPVDCRHRLSFRAAGFGFERGPDLNDVQTQITQALE